MKKSVNIFLLNIVLLSILYTPITNGVLIVSYKASSEIEKTAPVATNKTVHVEDIHELDWTLLNVGDQLDIDVQDLDNFNDYVYMQDEWKDIATYSPEKNTYTLVADERDIQPSVQPKYVVDTDEEIYFGTTYNANSTRGFFGLYGYIQMITRPNYNYTHSESSWSNAGSGENSWYASVDPDYAKGVKLKYKEEGSFKSTKYAAFNFDWNTQTVHIDPANAYGEFMLCTLPENNMTYNCNHKEATNVASIGYAIKPKYLTNQFISMRFNAGTYKEESELEILGLNTHAYVESFGEITTSNKKIYVGLGTSLEEAHDKTDPRYNEFVENVVTAVGREIPFSDLQDDGGYDPDTVGVYKFEYKVEKGFDGGFVDTEYVDVHVVDPDQTTVLEAYDTTYPKTYAPATETEILERMKVYAYDPNFEEEVTNQVHISNYGGYNPANPRVGQYTITFYINASNGETVYKNATLRIISPALSEEVTVTQTIIDDEDGDLLVSPGELITFEVVMDNTTGVDLDKPHIIYSVDDNYLLTDTFELLDGKAKVTTTGDSQLDIKYDHIFKDQTVSFKYQIEASSDWYIHTAEQDLTNLINRYYIEAYGYDYTQELPAGLFAGVFTSFDSSFTAADVDGDRIITPGEQILTTDVFTNNSYYSLFDISIHIGDGDKIDSTPTSTVVTSDMRDISTSDYLLDDSNQLFVYNVMPGESITIDQTFNANQVFNTVDDVELDSTHKVYGQTSLEVAHEQVLTEYFTVNKDDIYNVSVQTSITDYVNNALSPGEEFEIMFSIENNGFVNSNDVLIEIDLNDINIDTSELSVDNVELTLYDENQNQIGGESKILDNQVQFKQIKPGQKLVGYVILQATPQFDTDAFVSGLSDANITVPIAITDSFDDVYQKELSLPIDTELAANLKTTASVVELIGDGDGKVDPYESFEYIFNLENTGQIDLNMLTIALGINDNGGVTVDSYTVELFDNGSKYEDYTLKDDILTINHLDPSHEIVANVIVNYSFPLYENLTTNLFTINQQYLEQEVRQFNIGVDVENNQNVELTATVSDTTVVPGQVVNVELVSSNTGSTIEHNTLISLNSEDGNALISNATNITINDGEYKLGEDYELTDSGILIYEQTSSEQLTINFDLAISKPLYINPSEDDYSFTTRFTQQLENKKVVTDSVEFVPEITDAAITTNLEVRTATGEELVKTSDGLVYTYTIENGSEINLTNAVVKVNKSDVDLKTINSFTVSSTDESFEYTVNNITDTVKFNNLGANETVTITANATTNRTFDSSSTVDATFSLSSDFVTHTDTVSIAKALGFTTKVETSSSLLSTSSGNLLVGADEIVKYQVRIDNVGNADISNLIIDTNIEVLGNLVSQSISSVTINDSEVVEMDGYSYDQENAILIIEQLKVGEVVTVIFDIQTSDSIEYVESIPVTNTITSDYVDELEQINLYIDTSHIGNLEIDYYLEETNSDSDGKVDPGEVNYINIVLTNTDFIALDDIYVYDTMDDPNLTDYFLDVEVYDGDDNLLVEGLDYNHNGDYVHIPSIEGNSLIRGRVKLVANETFTSANNATISSLVRATFPTVGTVDTPFEVTIPLDKPNNIDYDLGLEITNANGNQFVAPGDTINVEVEMTNTGKVDIEDAHIIFSIDDNVDVTTIQLDFLSSFNASVDGMHVIVNQLPVGETITIKGSVKTYDTFNSNSIIEFNAGVDHQTVEKYVTDSLLIDSSSSALNVDYDLIELNGDGDNLIDPNESYDLIFSLQNTGNIELANIELINTGLSPNIKSMAYDGTLSLVDGNDVTIKSIKAGEKQVIKYHIDFANIFNEDLTANIDFNISQANIEDIAIGIIANIDTANLTSIESSLTVTDASDNQMASNNEELTYVYKVSNTGSRNISNLVIESDLADKNLTDTPYDQVLTINGVEQVLNYTDTTKSYLVPELKVGEELVLEYKVSTQNVLTYSVVQRLFNQTISNSVHISTADGTINQRNLVKIAIDPEILQLSAVARIEDEGRNGYLSANENLVYELELSNIGATHLNLVSTRKSQTGNNIVTTNNITVRDGDGNLLVENEDYTVTDQVVTIARIDAGEKVIISYQMSAASSLYMNGSTNIRSIISNEYIASQTLNTSILPDSAQRLIEYDFSSVLSNQLSYLDFSKQAPSQLIITNKGNAIENDFKVSVDNISNQLKFVADSLMVEKNGTEYSQAYYDNKLEVITIPEMKPGDTVRITVDTKFDDTIIGTEDSDTITFDYDVRADFSDKSTKLLETSSYILKEQISNITVRTLLSDPLTDTNLTADAEEVITGRVIVYNNGYLKQDNLKITIEANEQNAIADSFEVLSVQNLVGTDISTSEYQVEGNDVVLNDLAHDKTIVIKYQYKLNDYLDLGQDLDLLDLFISDTVTATSSVDQTLHRYPFIAVNPYVSSVKAAGLAVDEDNNQSVVPDERIYATYQFTNDGQLVQYDMPLAIEAYSSNIHIENVSAVEVDLLDENGDVSKLNLGEDYSFDPDSYIIYLNQLMPGQTAVVNFEYDTPSIIQNSELLITSMSAKPELRSKVRKSLQMPIDLEAVDHISSTSSLTRDETVSSNQQEKITYTVDLLNDGQVEYMQLFTTIYLTESNFDGLESVTLEVSKNGEEYIPYQVELYDAFIAFELYDVNVGDEFHIEMTYTIDGAKPATKSSIDTMIYSTGYVDVLEDTVRLEADTVTPEIEKEAPYISGVDTVTIAEETMISDAVLNQLFEIETNQGSGRELSVDYDIDTSIPGEYIVTYRLEDTLTSAEPAVFQPKLIVEDKLPVITGKDKVVIDRTETIDDLMTEFNISATEINAGDLTAVVTISENIEYGVIGNYPVNFAVSDNEGNTTQFTATVEIVNSLYPFLTGEDVVLTSEQASQLTTDQQILEAVNAFARNYDGTNLTPDIELITDDGFIADGGSYSNGDNYFIEYKVTNNQNRSVSEQSKIIINDNANQITISSNSPIIVKIDERANLEDITDLANPTAHLSIDGVTSSEQLTTANIIEANYQQNSVGLYMVKYEYQASGMRATHNVLVFATEDGVMPDNELITITDSVTTKVMPGDQIEYMIEVTNDSFRTKIISSIAAAVSSPNVAGVETVDITLSGGQEASYTTSKLRTSSDAYSINDLKIPSGETARINLSLATNELFSYEQVIDTNITYQFDGSTINSQLETEVDQNAIQLQANTILDKDVYYEGSSGTANVTITNNGTMDSQELLVDMAPDLTNVEIISTYLDGEITSNQTTVTVKAKQSIEIEINFKVKDTVIYGQDIIKLIDDFGRLIEIEVPVDCTVVIEEESEVTNRTSDGEEDDSQMTLSQTGKSSILLILIIILVLFIGLRVRNR